jgi:hypothetical protein
VLGVDHGRRLAARGEHLGLAVPQVDLAVVREHAAGPDDRRAVVEDAVLAELAEAAGDEQPVTLAAARQPASDGPSTGSAASRASSGWWKT